MALERIATIQDEVFDEVGPALLDSLVGMMEGVGGATSEAGRSAGSVIEKLLAWQTNK